MSYHNDKVHLEELRRFHGLCGKRERWTRQELKDLAHLMRKRGFVEFVVRRRIEEMESNGADKR